jgi:uncharacterized protein YjiS (DUF1127 family)
MSIIITWPVAAIEHEAEASPRPGLLRRIMAAMAESRRLSAERRIAAYFETQSDQRLADLGFSPADISALRARGRRFSGPLY